MAGYFRYKMSNNAVDAYLNGEKPLSKWTKADILSEVERVISDEEIEIKFDIKKLKTAPLSALKDLCLSCTAWHHTSSHYNRTNFYSVNGCDLEYITDEDIENKIQSYSKKPEEKVERWRCAYLVWSGTKNHPKATECISDGVIKGCWFYLPDGSKKKTTANGFKFLEKLEEAEEIKIEVAVDEEQEEL